MAEFLLEIGIEEIPARMLRKAEKDLKAGLEKVLTESGLAYEPLEAHGAPRQLVVFSRSVAERQEDRVDTITGPPVRIAYDGDGNATKALQGFLRKNPALSEDKLFRIEEKKGEIVAGKVEVMGRKTIDILAEAIPEVLGKLHFPKAMRWGSCPTRFVRPVRNLLALFGDAVIPFAFAECEAGNTSFGHRFAGERSFPISGIDHYLAEKDRNGIVVTHEERRYRIAEQIDERLATINGRLVDNDELMGEVADLPELPYVVLGEFDKKFLDIPKEVLITNLDVHQKSFCVQDATGKLMPNFIAIASVASDREGLVKQGQERVLHARLCDAEFFWETDLKKNFEDLRNKLKTLVFQSKIGSYHEKTERIARLAARMADALDWGGAEREDLDYAARHCKSDLVSDLVFEFAELQGIAGGLLLERKGMPDNVCQAVYDHYLPNSMDDDLPRGMHGALVSIADKLDTMVGCFAVGLIPTGTKDPFALRRAAQGIVRLLIEKEIPLSLTDLLTWALDGFRDVVTIKDDLSATLYDFVIDRVRYYFKRCCIPHELVNAVLATDTDRVDQTLKRSDAVMLQQNKDSFRNLALNLKRMNNVIADELEKLGDFSEDLLSEKAERQLWKVFSKLKPQIESAASKRQYNQAMDLMNGMADPVENYFGTSGVFVNVDDERIRLNRKAMIRDMRDTLGLVADISYLG